MERTRKFVIAICVLLGSSVLIALDTMFGGLRFVSSQANEVIDFAASGLPLVCVVCLGFLPRSRARLLGFVCLVPVAAFCVLGGIGDAVGESIFPATSARQSSLRLGHSQIVTYQDDDADGDDGCFFVQQEVKLLPGLLWVRPISTAECPRNIKITVLDRHHVQYEYAADTVDSYDPSPEAKRDIAWVF